MDFSALKGKIFLFLFPIEEYSSGNKELDSFLV